MSSAAAGPGRRAGWRSPLFLHPPPVLAIVISIVVTLLGVFAIRLLPISRYPADHAAGGAGPGDLPRRDGRRRRRGRRRADRGAAFRSPGPALLLVGQRERRDHEPAVYFDVTRNQDLAAVDVQNAVKLAEPQLPDAVRQNGITILKANTDILAVVALTSDDPALRRGLSHQLPEAVRRGRDQARAGHRQRAHLRRARLLDADPARSRPDGAARHHHQRRRGRGARAERHQSRRPARPRAGAAGHGARRCR